MLIFYLLLLVAGLAGGLLAGLLGIGGGIVFLLVLTDALLYLGANPIELPETQVANALLATLVSALASTYQHMRMGTPGRQAIAWIGLPAGVVGYLCLRFIVAQTFFSSYIFGWVLIVILTALLARSTSGLATKSPRAVGGQVKDLASLPPKKLSIIGILAGVVSSLTGLGGGILVVPLLREWLRVDVRPASFISSGTIVCSCLGALAFSLPHTPNHPLPGALGLIVPAVALPLGIGVVIAAPIGVRWSKRLSARTLTQLYAVLVALVLLRRLWLLLVV